VCAGFAGHQLRATPLTTGCAYYRILSAYLTEQLHSAEDDAFGTTGADKCFLQVRAPVNDPCGAGDTDQVHSFMSEDAYVHEKDISMFPDAEHGLNQPSLRAASAARHGWSRVRVIQLQVRDVARNATLQAIRHVRADTVSAAKD
jgi:hypothetical protein